MVVLLHTHLITSLACAKDGLLDQDEQLLAALFQMCSLNTSVNTSSNNRYVSVNTVKFFFLKDETVNILGIQCQVSDISLPGEAGTRGVPAMVMVLRLEQISKIISALRFCGSYANISTSFSSYSKVRKQTLQQLICLLKFSSFYHKLKKYSNTLLSKYWVGLALHTHNEKIPFL